MIESINLLMNTLRVDLESIKKELVELRNYTKTLDGRLADHAAITGILEWRLDNPQVDYNDDKYLQQINDPNVVSALTILNRDIELLSNNVKYLNKLTLDLVDLNSRVYELNMKIEGLERTCNTLNNKVFYGDDY